MYCEHTGCHQLPTVEAHYTIAHAGGGTEDVIRPLCEVHAREEGYCTFCGERTPDANPVSGLCAECIAEGVQL